MLLLFHLILSISLEMLKLKQLESYLTDVDTFEEPKVELEQYSTSAHIAARMVYNAATTYEDIEGCFVGDFGCGPGILSIASSLMGASFVCGFDVDQDALDTAWVNIHKLEIPNIDLTQTDVQTISLSSGFDTVLMNPPFGTRNSGIDTAFVAKGMGNSNAVYSLHKTSTREHFIRFAESSGYKLEVVAELRYDLPKTQKFHKQKSKDIEVDLYRFTHLS